MRIWNPFFKILSMNSMISHTFPIQKYIYKKIENKESTILTSMESDSATFSYIPKLQIERRK